MPDIKTMTHEITDLNIDLKESMLEGDYPEFVKVMEKIVEKLDELVTKINA